jgi:hypothetical protein
MKKLLFIITVLLSFTLQAQLRSAGTGTGNVVYSTSPTIATPSFTTGFTIGGSAGSGKILQGNGTNFVASTPTYPTSAGTAGKILRSDGTNYIESTPTFPNTATAGQQIVGDGTNWTGVDMRDDWTSFVVSGSDATTTGQALTNVTGLVSGTLSNSTRYEVFAVLNVGTSNVTTGTQYGIETAGSGGAGVVSALMIGTTTTNAVTQVTLSAPNAAQGTFLTTSSTSGIIYIHGFVTTRGSGTATISIQHLKVTSGTSTVRQGSKMLIRLAD